MEMVSPFPDRSLRRTRRHRLSVLLIDGDRDALDWYANYLRMSGLDVDTAETSGQALQMMRVCRPDVVVVDQFMPQMSGLEIADALRAERATSSIPLVLFTGAPVKEHRVGTVDACLAKPCAPSELLAVVRMLGGRA